MFFYVKQYFAETLQDISFKNDVYARLTSIRGSSRNRGMAEKKPHFSYS